MIALNIYSAQIRKSHEKLVLRRVIPFYFQGAFYHPLHGLGRVFIRHDAFRQSFKSVLQRVRVSRHRHYRHYRFARVARLRILMVFDIIRVFEEVRSDHQRDEPGFP